MESYQYIWCCSMKLSLITVGKQKEQYFKNKIVEYSKNIRKKIDIKEYEITDEGTECLGNIVLENRLREKEGKKILDKITSDDFVISLDILGKKISTEKLKSYIIKIRETHENIVFIIGGSIGLSSEVLQRSNLKISFGKMTYPHQLMKVVLLEQIDNMFK